MAVSTFKRRPPPLAAQYAFGAVIDGIVGPLTWGFEKLGRGERLLQSSHKRELKQIAKKNPFKGYTPTGHDVFVACYIKSGTNWTMQLAHQLLNHGKAEFDHIHSVIPWPDSKMFPPMRHYAVPIEDDSVWKASPEQKRVIKTHFAWEFLPYSEDARYIMVIRDPKDVFVSSYFFLGNGLGRAMPSVPAWRRLFQSDNFMMGGSWAAHSAGYWAQRHKPNVLILWFKQMKRDLRGAVLKVAEFLDVRVPDQVIDSVAEQSSFQYMKRIDQKFEVWKMVPWRRSATTMMRKGTQGGSSELLSPEQQQEMDAYFMAELKRLGSDLPYEEFADVTVPVLA